MQRKAIAFGPVAVLLLALVCGAATPTERGPYAVGEARFLLSDAVRGREIDLLAIFPIPEGAAPRPTGGFPLIVFVHGFLLRGDAYRSYADRLASHGFVVALPTLRMSLLGVGHNVLAQDVRYVIDRCLAMDGESGSELYGVIDETRIGSSGHSLGGKLALLEATTDPRVRAIAALDPVDAASPGVASTPESPSVAPELMAQIGAPLLFVGAELGAEVALFTACAPEGENYRAFFEAARSPAIEVTQQGVGHGQYVDPGAGLLLAACARGAIPDDDVRASATAYLTAFFLGHLLGDAWTLAWLDERLAADVGQGLVIVRRK